MLFRAIPTTPDAVFCRVSRWARAGASMATIVFNIKDVSRGRGSSAVSRAAYISRDKLHDERLGRNFDFRKRGGLEHSEILLPAQTRSTVMDWARDRANLWNEAEGAERRANAQVAREYVVALPHELSARDRLELARGFAQNLADRYSVAADLAVHTPPPGGDPRNHHAHILATTRDVTSEGFGRKTDLALNRTDRYERGLSSHAEEIRTLRHAWADRVNEQLRQAQLEVRVDARSYWEQGIARVPRPVFSPGLVALERKGAQPVVAERLREEHAARQRLMTEFAAAHARSSARSAELTLLPSANPQPEHPRGEAVRPLSLDERQQRAAERWLEYRRERESGLERGASAKAEKSRDRGAEFEI